VRIVNAVTVPNAVVNVGGREAGISYQVFAAIALSEWDLLGNSTVFYRLYRCLTASNSSHEKP
jgi:hypothetical protein